MPCAWAGRVQDIEPTRITLGIEVDAFAFFAHIAAVSGILCLALGTPIAFGLGAGPKKRAFSSDDPAMRALRLGVVIRPIAGKASQRMATVFKLGPNFLKLGSFSIADASAALKPSDLGRQFNATNSLAAGKLRGLCE